MVCLRIVWRNLEVWGEKKLFEATWEKPQASVRTEGQCVQEPWTVR